MAADERPVTVVIADDNDLLLDALRLAVSAADGLEVVATASDGAGAVEAVRAHGPDVVLIDLRLGSEWGLDVVPALRDGPRAPEVVVFSAAELDGVVDEAARVGVSRLVPKGAPLEDVIRTLADAGSERRAGEGGQPPGQS
ncbi:MAG TPA: response regulator [Acidimicrobiales bacterium]|nr:response regulator [Acidimicrobiales bacterium]